MPLQQGNALAETDEQPDIPMERASSVPATVLNFFGRPTRTLGNALRKRWKGENKEPVAPNPGSIREAQRTLFEHISDDKLNNYLPSSDNNQDHMNYDYDPDDEILPIEVPDLDIETLSRDLANHIVKAAGFEGDPKAEEFAQRTALRWLDNRTPQMSALRRIADYAVALKHGGLPNKNGEFTPKPVFDPEKDDAKEFINRVYDAELSAGILDSKIIKNSGNKSLVRHIENKIHRTNGEVSWDDYNVMPHGNLLGNLRDQLTIGFPEYISSSELLSAFRSVLGSSTGKDVVAAQGQAR